jgi:hypothetical protein
MRIVFSSENYCIWYRPIYLNDFDYEPQRKHLIYQILENKFKSIRYAEEIPTDFVFDDPADEAAFLLWSSDGIKL